MIMTLLLLAVKVLFSPNKIHVLSKIIFGESIFFMFMKIKSLTTFYLQSVLKVFDFILNKEFLDYGYC